MGCYNWFHHTETINMFYQNLTFPLGVNNCLDMFSRKVFFMVCYLVLNYKVIGKSYLKFPFDIREFPYKLRIDEETNRQNIIYATLSGRLTGSKEPAGFKEVIESIIKGCSTANKIER